MYQNFPWTGMKQVFLFKRKPVQLYIHTHTVSSFQPSSFCIKVFLGWVREGIPFFKRNPFPYKYPISAGLNFNRIFRTMGGKVERKIGIGRIIVLTDTILCILCKNCRVIRENKPIFRKTPIIFRLTLAFTLKMPYNNRVFKNNVRVFEDGSRNKESRRA